MIQNINLFSCRERIGKKKKTDITMDSKLNENNKRH